MVLIGTISLMVIVPFGVMAEELNVVDGTLTSSPTGATTTEEVLSSIIAPEENSLLTIEKLGGTVNQGDFVVGPGRLEIEVKPGQTVTHYMTVANRISDNRTFELVVEDITGSSNADRAVTFMGDEQGPYTIKDYISFPQKNFKLNLGERAKFPITISVPEDAEPGGYYGGVLVSTVKDDGVNDGAGSARSPIVARIGTLFFLTVPGNILKEGNTKSLTLIEAKSWYEKGPINFSILSENTGSIHLNPYGEMRVKNIFGEEVSFIELEPWFVLPKSMRSRDVSFDREMLFGRYTATAFVNRGYDDIVDEVSVSFWVLPWKVVLPAFLFLFIVLFSVRFLARNFEFKRKA